MGDCGCEKDRSRHFVCDFSLLMRAGFRLVSRVVHSVEFRFLLGSDLKCSSWCLLLLGFRSLPLAISGFLFSSLTLQ